MTLTLLTFAAIVAMIAAYAQERLPAETVSVAALAGWLLLFGLVPPLIGVESPLGPDDILAGLSNQALLTVLALLVVGQGLFHTDALATPAAWVTTRAKGAATVLVILAAAMAVSAVVNDTPVVVMFLPIVTAVAVGRGQAASRTLMPLSFAALLGGMTTLIGTSTNLLVAGVARERGVEVGFFDLTVPAAAMAAVGFAYIAFAMPRLLAPRAGPGAGVAETSGRQFIAQIDVTDRHPLAGVASKAGLFPELKDMTVRAVQRGGRTVLPPYEDVTLRAGDSLVIAATRSALTAALSRRAAAPAAGEAAGVRSLTVAETVVAPGSRLVGRTLAHAPLYHDTGATVVGVERRSRMPRIRPSEIRLEAGDVLLMGGRPEAIEELRGNRDLLLLEASTADVPQRRYARRALLIFGLFVLYAASGIGPVVTGAICAAVAMVLAGCLNARQAIRALDFRIYLMVGAALAAAAALEATGGARLIADGVLVVAADQPPWILLSMLFLTVAVLTNILSNNATAVLFAPVALNMAADAGLAPLPFLVAVMLGASCAFATPVGYQTNMLVMGPGHYRFRDFVVAGAPLVILMWLVFSVVGPWYYF